jgi:hypothetical protein
MAVQLWVLELVLVLVVCVAVEETAFLGNALSAAVTAGDATPSGTADSEELRRRTSLNYDLNTYETVRTYNGRVPRISCPMGFYRPTGGSDLAPISGVRQDGCVQCPRGRYGSAMGVTSAECSGPCPLGSYSTRMGLTSPDVSRHFPPPFDPISPTPLCCVVASSPLIINMLAPV